MQWVMHDAWRVVFTIIGIALGVSVFVATLVAHRSVQVSFSRTVEAFGGGGWWEVYSNSPDFPEDIVIEFKRISPPITVVPIVEQKRTVQCVTNRGMQYTRINLVGIDAFSLPYLYKRGDGLSYSSNQLVKFISDSANFAFDARLGRCKRMVLEGQDIAVEGGILLEVDPGLEAAPLVVQDISWVQDSVRKQGVLSHVFLRPSDVRSNAAMIAVAEGHGLVVQRVADRGNRFSRVTEAFRINLIFLSTCALLVASYLIHSLVTFWCLKRRDDVAVLRSIGVSSATVRNFMLIEVCLLGFLGGVFGIIMGILMSKGMESIVSQTISALYQRVPVGDLTVELWVVPLVLVIVIFISMSGGLGPAKRLSETPIAVLKSEKGASDETIKVRSRLACGLGVIISSILFSLLVRNSSFLWIGLGTPLLFLVGAVMIVAPILRVSLDRVRRVRDYMPVAFQLAIDHLLTTFSRSVGAVTALMISAGLFIAIDLMVSSFSGSLQNWLEEILKADIYISIDERSEKGISSIPQEMVSRLNSLPGVESVDTAATVVGEYHGRPFQFTGVSFDLLKAYHRLHLIHSAIEPGQIELPSVFVSEPFARWHHVREGDVLGLFGEGPKLFVEGIYRDYSTENGVVLVDHAVFRKMFDGVPVRSASIYLNEGVDAGRVMADIRSLPWEGEVSVRSEEALRGEIFRIFRATFRVTEVLMWLTLIVALWVISNTITIMIAERSFELQVLRSIGASRAQLIRMIALEAGLLGLFGIAASILCGSGLALILVYIVNPFFFGWTLSPHWSWRMVVILIGGVPVLTSLTGATVGLLVFRKPIQGIKYE